MKKKLTPSGNGYVLHIPKPLMKFLGYAPPDTKLLFSMNDRVLTIKKLDDEEVDKYKDYLVKGLSKRGTGWGIFLSNTVLDLLDIAPDEDFLDYNIIDGLLIIKKAD